MFYSFGLTTADTGHIARIRFECSHDGLLAAEAGILNVFQRLQNTLVIFWHDFNKLGHHLLPIGENRRRSRAARVGLVALNHFPDLLDLIRILQLLEFDHLRIASPWEIAGFVQYISESTGHTGGEIAASRPKNDDAAASHVFAAVI